MKKQEVHTYVREGINNTHKNFQAFLTSLIEKGHRITHIQETTRTRHDSGWQEIIESAVVVTEFYP